MTNKKPEVGKKYKAKKKKSYFNVGDEMKVIRINYLDHLVHFKYFFELSCGEGEFKFNDFDFWEYFEELPEDNQTDRVAKMKNLAQDGSQHNSDLKVWLKAHPDCIQTSEENTPTLSKEVLEAMEDAKKELEKYPSNETTEFSLMYHLRWLYDALDNQFKAELEITDGKIQTDSIFIIDTEKSDLESLPNSISEIDELQALVHHQNFSPELVVYLERILDQHNSLLDRVERLEQIIGDKK